MYILFSNHKRINLSYIIYVNCSKESILHVYCEMNDYMHKGLYQIDGTYNEAISLHSLQSSSYTAF